MDAGRTASRRISDGGRCVTLDGLRFAIFGTCCALCLVDSAFCAECSCHVVSIVG